jgi:hypothetical protein
MTYLDDGVFSKIDTDNLYKLMFHEEIDIEFVEFDIDSLETSPENIAYIETISSEYGCEMLEDENCCRIRYLMDGTVTEMRCSYAAQPDDFIRPIGHHSLFYIVNNKQFAYIIKEFSYSMHNFKDAYITAPELRESIYKAGDGQSPYFSLENDGIHLFFTKRYSTKEMIFPDAGNVTEEAYTFQKDGKEYSIGLNSEGKSTYTIRSYSQLICSSYRMYDLDYLNFSIEEIRDLIASSGEYQKMTITYTDNMYNVAIFFGDEFTTTELKLTRFSDNIVETIGFYRYDGKCIQLGLDPDGKICIGYIGNYTTEYAE